MARFGTNKCGYCIGPVGAVRPHCENPDGRCDCVCTGKPQPEPAEDGET